MAVKTIDQVFADYAPDGSVNEPNLQDIRLLLTNIQAMATAAGMETYPNKAVMDADLTQEDGQPALLWADPTPANNFPTVWVYNDATNTWIAGIDRIEPIRLQQVIDGLRLEDLENDSLPVDFDDTNQFEIINTAISNPASRYTWSVVDDALVVNQTFVGLLLIGFLTNYGGLKNRSFSCRYVCTTTDAASGFGVCFNPSGGSVIDPTNHVAIVWRANSGLIVAYRQDGNTPVSALTAPGATTGVVIDASVPRVTWGNDDVVEMAVVLDADGTTGTFTTLKNGESAASFRVTGLPVGYIGAVGRNQIATTASFGSEDQPVLISKVLQSGKTIFINPNVGQSSIGTEANPFKTFADGLRYVNESGRELVMVPKEGIYATPPEIQTNRYDKVVILGDQGKRPLIRPGTLLTSGWALVGASVKVYSRVHVFGGTTGAVTGSGAFIDLTNSDGPWGFTHYQRLLPLSGSIAALEALPAGVGGYWIDSVNGLAYIKCVGNANPNDLDIFRAEWSAGINLMPAPASLAGMTSIHVAGIDVEFPYAHGILAGRVRGLIEDCTIKGAAALNAISPNMMTGEIANCRGWRCWNDGINHTPAPDFQPPNPTPGRVAELRVIDCEMTDMVVGDGLSNHQEQDNTIIGGTYARNGKCGIVAVGNATIIGAKVHGNAAEAIGALATNPAGSASTHVSARDCHLWDNGVGYSAVTPDIGVSGVQNTATVEILGGSCTGSTTALFRMRNDAPTGGTAANPCQIRARNLARSGNTSYRDDVPGAHSQVGWIEDLSVPIAPGAF